MNRVVLLPLFLLFLGLARPTTIGFNSQPVDPQVLLSVIERFRSADLGVQSERNVYAAIVVAPVTVPVSDTFSMKDAKKRRFQCVFLVPTAKYPIPAKSVRNSPGQFILEKSTVAALRAASKTNPALVQKYKDAKLKLTDHTKLCRTGTGGGTGTPTVAPTSTPTSGGGSNPVATPTPTRTPTRTPTPTPNTGGASGASLYVSNCQPCHGGPGAVGGASASDINAAINGNRGGMGYLKNSLSSTQINAIASYLANQ